jgi:two-component system heavy metal sensor histidine kinase CusS
VVVLAIDTTENRKLLRDHAAVATLVAVVGTFLSGLLGWFVARRGLAPIAQVAARAGQVTAQRLGARLDLQEAPKEVHGLGESINHMLERLEESFRALEQFSADIAHELRTPLNNLLLQTQVTLSRPRTEAEYQETLHSNLVELERLQRMVADMLFLARADRGMLELALEDVELADEARSVTEYFEAAASERSQSIRIEGRAIVRGDRLMIRRALTNLLSNAVRYSPPGSPIVVEAGSDARGAFAAVSNPAVELPEQELRRLFARFARRDDSRGREVEGVGLGLAIVDSIMKLHRGSVEPESDARHIVFRLRFAGPVPTEA